MKQVNVREAVFLALQQSARNEQFISDSLDKWGNHDQPSHADAQLARQLAYGVCQRALTLDYLSLRLADKKRLSLKLKEKIILRMALYQYYFLERIPLYAIVDESVRLAKRYCHPTFGGFLNAALRKLPQFPLNLPEDDSVESLSIRYSYPVFYIESLMKDWGLESAKPILSIQNKPAPVMVRIREPDKAQQLDLQIVSTNPLVGVLTDHSLMFRLTSSSAVYIQNITPVYLIGWLVEQATSSGLNPGMRVLDLCAAPGGKLIAIHDYFPAATLVGNDLTPEKVKLVKENCEKYQISAQLCCGDAKEFPSDQLFDLVILDVPCSNSGVLNKRAEARWRLSSESLGELQKTQIQLIEKAISLLAPGGQLWYLTCSILKEENEQLMSLVCSKLNLKSICQKTILPNEEGWDGGFACLLQQA